MSLRALLTIRFALCVLLPACVPVMSTESLLDPLTAGWRGEKVCELLDANVRQRVLRCTFAPGVGHERHYHAPHFGYVLAGGKMRIKDASGVREMDVKKDSIWSSDGVDWHEVLNVGKTTAIYLIIEPLS